MIDVDIMQVEVIFCSYDTYRQKVGYSIYLTMDALHSNPYHLATLKRRNPEEYQFRLEEMFLRLKEKMENNFPIQILGKVIEIEAASISTLNCFHVVVSNYTDSLGSLPNTNYERMYLHPNFIN
jgi:hypothetical protein